MAHRRKTTETRLKTVATRELNAGGLREPTDYQSAALPLGYRGIKNKIYPRRYKIMHHIHDDANV